MKLSARLLLGSLGILLFAVLLLAWAFRTALRRDLETNLAESLRREAELIRDALPADPRAWDRLVGRLAGERGHRVTLIEPDGRPARDNQVAPAQLRTLGSLAELPEVRAALAGRVGVARHTEGSEQVVLFVAVPGDPVVRVGSDLLTLERTVAQAQRSVLWAALLALAAGTGLAYAGIRRVARPLDALADAARALPEGRAPRLARSRVPELDQLADALREMHTQLADHGTALTRGRAEAAAVVDAMLEGVLTTDERGRIATANPAARRLLGYGADAALPDLPQLFRSREAREVVGAVLAGAMVQDRELEVAGRVLLANSRPLPAGGAVLVLHDVTRLRRLEAVRRDFVANVSHELKTPLTVISGYVETLLRSQPGAEDQRAFLETVASHARRMQQLVDDQLSLARIESGTWEPRPERVDVRAAAGEAWAARAGRAAAVPVRLRVEAAPGAETVHADPGALGQILGNLFDNAIRYSPAGAEIICRAEPFEGGVRLAVADAGAGIPGEHLPRVFERYYRADPARSREEGGTGLGLSIVKHLVEAHAGTVRIESELGRGTTVYCWFPAGGP